MIKIPSFFYKQYLFHHIRGTLFYWCNSFFYYVDNCFYSDQFILLLHQYVQYLQMKIYLYHLQIPSISVYYILIFINY